VLVAVAAAGEFVDDYTVRVVDVFAMPQSGTGVSVEAVDPVFQTKMLDMLKQVGRWGYPGQHNVMPSILSDAHSNSGSSCRQHNLAGMALSSHRL
jgi:hypothetical protein